MIHYFNCYRNVLIIIIFNCSASSFGESFKPRSCVTLPPTHYRWCILQKLLIASILSLLVCHQACVIYFPPSRSLLVSLFDANRGAEKDVNNRVKLRGQNGGKLQGDVRQEYIGPTNKVYTTAIQLVMVRGAESWAVIKKEEKTLHRTEMLMLRWARGKTRL